jgi:hypothetical protein
MIASHVLLTLLLVPIMAVKMAGLRHRTIKLVKHLWAGQLPLEQAFWHYAVSYGLLINLVTHLAFLALIMRDANIALIALAFALPVPYNVLVTVAVWRSANYYPGPKTWAEWARVGTVIWMVVLTLA